MGAERKRGGGGLQTQMALLAFGSVAFVVGLLHGFDGDQGESLSSTINEVAPHKARLRGSATQPWPSAAVVAALHHAQGDRSLTGIPARPQEHSRRHHRHKHSHGNPAASAKAVIPPAAAANAAASAAVASGKGPEIAVCLGYTTKTSKKNRPRQAIYGLKGQSPLFRDLVPSLCATMSPGFRYSMWIGYDHDDPLLSIEGTPELMREALSQLVPGCSVTFHLLEMGYGGNPTWAQNDAVMAAHKAGADYFYRVNDDSVMASQGWTQLFVTALAGMKPQNVGVVGPHHSGGNMVILTYDFTSRKHVEIFGFHYPREFRSWWGDDWITLVYKPDNMRKLPAVKLDHKLEDIRYSVGENKAQLGILQREVDKYKARLKEWIQSHPRG